MVEENKIVQIIKTLTQHYNHKKYWIMRSYVLQKSKGLKLVKLYYLFKIKRMDAFNGASFGTHIGYGAKFESPPLLPHGLRGIFISHNAQIGRNVKIYHQVTIGEGNNGAPIIGNNVIIGAGAKIIGRVHIGNNAKIGANCIVFKDIPDNATVVMDAPRVIIKEECL